MFLPKSKYTIKVAKAGQFSYDGRPYTGPYIETYKGAKYPGKDISKITDPSKQLKDLTEFPKIEIPLLDRKVDLAPTPEDYKKGRMIRYFQKNNKTGVLKELNKEQYDARIRSTEGFTTGFCTWILVGQLEDFYVGKYPGKGVKTRNQEAINRLEETLRGVSLYLPDPGQYVVERIDTSGIDKLLK